MSAPYQFDSWQAWHEAMLAPLEPQQCGEDLKYDDGFKQLKASSSGVGEQDFKALFILGSELVQQKSKDLRLASYLCLAATHEFGLVGFYHSLAVFNDLVRDFGVSCHPHKAKAKSFVHVWFLQQQERLIALAEQQQNVPAQLWHELKDQVSRYGDECVKLLDPESGPLATISSWAQQGCSKNPVVVSEPNVKENSPQTSNEKATQTAAAPAATQRGAAQELALESDYMAVVRQLLAFDREQKNWSRLLQVARATRWATMKLPPNEGGKTRIPAPRNTAFTPIENALADDLYDDAILAAEALFMEGAMHFNLDLQMHTLAALKKANRNALVTWLTEQIRLLVKRLPELTELKYDDGSAFCSAKSKAQIIEMTEQENASPTVASDDPLLQKQNELLNLVESEDLPKVLTEIENLTQNNEVSRLRAQLLTARVLIKAEKAPQALPLFNHLLKLVDECHLVMWQQQLAMEIWRYAMQCFKALAQGDDEQEFSQQAIEIEKKMLVTNVTTAIGWI